jgi:23S rRNA G2069 N7-methylase RlmK/C1962 C5-methylase RlmI
MPPIYSLFAAKAGASSFVAVDGSAKMASVATQVCHFSLQNCIKVPTSLYHDSMSNL